MKINTNTFGILEFPNGKILIELRWSGHGDPSYARWLCQLNIANAAGFSAYKGMTNKRFRNQKTVSFYIGSEKRLRSFLVDVSELIYQGFVQVKVAGRLLG